MSFAALRDDRRSSVGSCRSVRPFAPAACAWTLARAAAFLESVSATAGRLSMAVAAIRHGRHVIARPAVLAATRRAEITLVVTRRDVFALEAHE